MAAQFLTIDNQAPNASLEIVDADGQHPVIPLLTAAQVATLVGLSPGAYDGEPLAWNAGLAQWQPRTFVVVDNVDAQNVAGPGSALLLLRAQTVVNREDNYQIGFLSGPGNHIQTAIVGGATCMQWVTDDATGTPKFRAFDNGTAVVRQSITGVTTQDQVDSIVSALVALGWVSDNR